MAVTNARGRMGFLFAGMKWRTCLAAALAASLLNICADLHAAPVEASAHQMSLSHHEFESWAFKPHPGDRIDITNRSDISHSLYITYPDGTVVNLGVQLPGATVSWTVPETGAAEYLFQCWIHPIIRATVVVQDAGTLSATDVSLAVRRRLDD